MLARPSAPAKSRRRGLPLLGKRYCNGETVNPAIKPVFRTASMLGFAAIIGIVIATTTTCGVGLAHGTGTWCGLPFAWFIGIPVATVVALIFGLPLAFLFRKLRLTRWWQFGITGFLCAIPAWVELAQPFASVRWAQSGLYDSLNYLGSGLAGGLAYWRICKKVGIRSSNDEMAGQSSRPA